LVINGIKNVTYKLLSEQDKIFEQNKENIQTIESPFGKEIVGKKNGDSFMLRGKFYEIFDISYNPEDFKQEKEEEIQLEDLPQDFTERTPSKKEEISVFKQTVQHPSRKKIFELFKEGKSIEDVYEYILLDNDIDPLDPEKDRDSFINRYTKKISGYESKNPLDKKIDIARANNLFDIIINKKIFEFIHSKATQKNKTIEGGRLRPVRKGLFVTTNLSDFAQTENEQFSSDSIILTETIAYNRDVAKVLKDMENGNLPSTHEDENNFYMFVDKFINEKNNKDINNDYIYSFYQDLNAIDYSIDYEQSKLDKIQSVIKNFPTKEWFIDYSHDIMTETLTDSTEVLVEEYLRIINLPLYGQNKDLMERASDLAKEIDKRIEIDINPIGHGILDKNDPKKYPESRQRLSVYLRLNEMEKLNDKLLFLRLEISELEKDLSKLSKTQRERVWNSENGTVSFKKSSEKQFEVEGDYSPRIQSWDDSSYTLIVKINPKSPEKDSINDFLSSEPEYTKIGEYEWEANAYDHKTLDKIILDLSEYGFQIPKQLINPIEKDDLIKKHQKMKLREIGLLEKIEALKTQQEKELERIGYASLKLVEPEKLFDENILNIFQEVLHKNLIGIKMDPRNLEKITKDLISAQKEIIKELYEQRKEILQNINEELKTDDFSLKAWKTLGDDVDKFAEISRNKAFWIYSPVEERANVILNILKTKSKKASWSGMVKNARREVSRSRVSLFERILEESSFKNFLKD